MANLYTQKRSNRNINSILPAKQSVYAFADTVNHANFPAFTRSLHEQYVQLLLTNTLGGTYYSSKKELVDGTHELNKRMLAHDVTFMGKALVYARNEGFMRLQPIIGLVYLSTAEIPYSEFEKIFNQVILTPGDLQDFVEIVRSGAIRKGLGRRIKKAVNQWLIGISEYHIIKYGSESAKFSLRDILRLTRPKVSDYAYENDTPTIHAKFQYLLGNDADLSLLPQIALLEALKKSKGNEQEVIRLIHEGHLPHEVVTGIVQPTKGVWRAIQKQMPTFALLRNLRTLHKHDALDAAAFAERMNVDAIKKAKIFPFRIYMAYRECFDLGMPKVAINALSLALDNSAEGLPRLPKRTVVALDVSGSMVRAMLSDNSSMSAIEVGAVFVGVLARTGSEAELLLFDTVTKKIDINPNTPVLTTIEKLAGIKGGGTDLASPIEYVYNHKMDCDVFIGITDSEDWAGAGFLRAWSEYRSKRNKNARAYLIQLTPNRALSAPPSDDSVVYIHGWNTEVLKFISLDSQIEHIIKSF